jgi:hypothetical protein
MALDRQINHSEMSFVSDASTFVQTRPERFNIATNVNFLSPTLCVFEGCTSVPTKFGVFKMINGQSKDQSWCSSQNWCSYHRRVELLGPCEKRKKTDAKNYAKVSPKHSSHYSQ